MPHRCLPIEPDPCLTEILKCAGLSLDALDDVMAQVQGELSDDALAEVWEIVNALLAKLSEFSARLSAKLQEIASLQQIVAALQSCLAQQLVPCASAQHLVEMLLARRDELQRQVAELESNLDPVDGLPGQAAKFLAVATEMECWRANAATTREVIDEIQHPPEPPVPPAECP